MLEIFDNDSYSNQCINGAAAVAPLVAVGEFYSRTLQTVALVVAVLLVAAGYVLLWLKQGVCPKWLRDLISDVTSIYLFFCLPAIIYIYHGNGSVGYLLFGVGMMFLAGISSFATELTSRRANAGIESLQEMKEEAGESKEELVEALFRDRWRVVNKLCDIYYEKSDSAGAMKFIVRDIEAELQELRSKESIRDILATADRCLDGEISRLQQECGEFLKEQDIEFVGLIYAGLSVRAVCYLTGLRKANFYQKKNRLMKRIAESDAPAREEFVERLAKFIK